MQDPICFLLHHMYRCVDAAVSNEILGLSCSHLLNLFLLSDVCSVCGVYTPVSFSTHEISVSPGWRCVPSSFPGKKKQLTLHRPNGEHVPFLYIAMITCDDWNMFLPLCSEGSSEVLFYSVQGGEEKKERERREEIDFYSILLSH